MTETKPLMQPVWAGMDLADKVDETRVVVMAKGRVLDAGGMELLDKAKRETEKMVELPGKLIDGEQRRWAQEYAAKYAVIERQKFEKQQEEEARRLVMSTYQQRWPDADISPLDARRFREMAELLVAKEQRIAELERRVATQVTITQRLHLGRIEQREVLDMFWPLVQSLYETTNSAGEHAQCKAALEAYQALGVPANAGASASAPEGLREPAMGDPNVSDRRDRQAGQGAGASGGQLLGPVGRKDIDVGDLVAVQYGRLVPAIPNSPWIRL